MKRRRLFLCTFLFSTAAGWAAAHFSVGNAGAVALRAAVSEGRMAFSTREKTAAAAQVASLAGKSLAAQAEIIAGWSNMTSIAAIRHLYAALDKVPYQLRHLARDVLLGRWAILDPDSLLLAALREPDVNKRGHFLRAFGRYWAAGRSPEEVADMLVSVAGDLRKFVPEFPAGGYYKPGAALLHGNRMLEQLGVDPRVLLDLGQRLAFKLPAEGYAAVFSALAKVDAAEARRRLEALTDPVARRAATAGIASQLACSDPAAALNLCATGDRDLVAAITPGYFKHLLSLPNGDAWQKAAAFSDQFHIRGNAMICFLQRMAVRDPAGLFQWMSDRPAQDRSKANFVLSMGAGPEIRSAMREYLSTAPYSAVQSIIPGMVGFSTDSGEASAMIQWLAASGRPDLQIAAASTLLYRTGEQLIVSTAETRQLLQMLHAAPLSTEAAQMLRSYEIRDDRTKSVAASVSRNWPESAALLDGLSPEARETALPGLIRGAATRDPAGAAALLATAPDTPAAAEAAAALAESWARYDLDAAQQWAQTLTGERRTRAEHALQSAVADWSTASTAVHNR